MPPDRPAGRPFATRSEVIAPRAMAATSQPLATQAAVEVLRAGGGAVDAAIAANAVLAVVEPTGCGPGGDLFAMVWEAASGRLHSYNGSGRSPAGLSLAVNVALIGFELLVATLQAYVFAILTCIYLHDAVHLH